MDRCPDAEVLAAWADDGLPGSERSRVERHAAECARCQAHLAAMARMAPEEPVPAPRRASLWTWLVPATAAVTAAALWVLVLPGGTPDVAPPPAAPSSAVDGPPAPSSPPPPARSEAPPAAAAPLAKAEAPAADRPRQLEAEARADRQALQERLMDARDRAAVTGASAESKESDAAANRSASIPANQSASIAYLRALPIVLMSPDGTTRWRGTNVAIERSTDGGATWHVQFTDVGEHITGGTAPSATAAWFIGARGMVLVTGDGTTWRRVPFPVVVDLSAIEAADARRAAVTTADGRRFVTTDAHTWIPQ